MRGTVRVCVGAGLGCTAAAAAGAVDTRVAAVHVPVGTVYARACARCESKDR